MYDTKPDDTCANCNEPLTRGPFGLHCARCVFSLMEEERNPEDSYLAELFPELRLEGLVGQGGFGKVYRAEHRQLRRPVALKFLDTVLARKAEAVALFQQEIVTVGGLDHPGIVRAHDAGERDGHWYIIMEFVEGLDVGALVKVHGRLPVAESCEIIRQAALALHTAHGKGLVHRDVKPGNIMVSRGEGTEVTTEVPSVLSVAQVPQVPSSVKVLDFGLARLAVAPAISDTLRAGEATTFVGTLEYISPEQIENPANVDARADIYSLGAMLWRLLTGKTPHGSEPTEATLFLRMKRMTTEPVPSLATLRPDVPKPLIQLCDAMLALDREKRTTTAAEVARLLEPWCAGAELPRLFTNGPLEEKPFIYPKRNRKRWWAASAAVYVSLGLGMVLLNYVAKPAAPEEPLPYRSLISMEGLKKQEISPENAPRLLTKDWEPISEYFHANAMGFARHDDRGLLVSVDTNEPDSIRRRERQGTVPAFELADKNQAISALMLTPDGHYVWGQPEHKKGLHIGRATPDHRLLPSLTYDFAPEFSQGFFKMGRDYMLSKGESVADGEPRGFAYVTAENLPPNTGLNVGDVVVVDYGDRSFGPLGKSKPGLWRFRLDDDAPVRRLAKAEVEAMPLDVTISKHGVFGLDKVFTSVSTARADDPRHSEHLWRWDLNGWHLCTVDKPLVDPISIAADPLTGDLYVMCGYHDPSLKPEHRCVQRVVPQGPDRYVAETIVTRLGKVGKGGLAFNGDGQKLIITDVGNRAVVALQRQDKRSLTKLLPQITPIDTALELKIPGWQVTGSLRHGAWFVSPQFTAQGKVLYWGSGSNGLRLASAENGESKDFLSDVDFTKLSSLCVSPLSDHVVWTQLVNPLQPIIGRATADAHVLPPLAFAGDTPPLPIGFAFVTDANLPTTANNKLRAGDVLVAGSKHPAHANSTAGLWKFRMDTDEPATQLVKLEVKDAPAVVISKRGVFLLTDKGIQCWDGTKTTPLNLSQQFLLPIMLVADPLSQDLYVLEVNRLLRLQPTGPDDYNATVLTEGLAQAVPGGISITSDGQRMLVGDYGQKKTWILERQATK